MKSRVVSFLCATSLLAAIATGMVAHAQQASAPHYAVIDLGTLPGGTSSQPFVINDNGVVSGSSIRRRHSFSNCECRQKRPSRRLVLLAIRSRT